MAVEQLYQSAVSGLPKDEQMRLATYIAWQCAKAGPIEYNSDWSNEDMRDVTNASVARFELREAEREAE